MIDLSACSSDRKIVLRAFAVTIDFFNTLVSVDSAQPAMHETLTGLGYYCDARTELRFNSESANGQLTPRGDMYDEWRRSRLEDLCTEVGVPSYLVAEIARRLIEIDRSWTVRSVGGAAQLLEALRATDTPHLILTNWDYALEPYLEQAGLPRSTKYLTSRIVGARKPHPLMFHLAAERLGVGGDHAVHVGDRWDADVVGARSVGWRVCWLTAKSPADAPDATPVASSLPYLLSAYMHPGGRRGSTT